MLSFAKLLTLAALVAAVWYGFKLVTALQRRRDGLLREQGRDRPERPSRRGRGSPPAPVTEDVVECPVCGVYVAEGTGACGRPGCPRRG